MKDIEKPQEQFEDMRILDELKNSYLNYAMSVIVSRALPDVRDGLKPSQRRILVAMNDLNLGPEASTESAQRSSVIPAATTTLTAIRQLMAPLSGWARAGICAIRWWTLRATSGVSIPILRRR